jgi:hypothetical protein
MARLLVVRIAPALLRLCRASRRNISPLDFSSVGRTGSRSFAARLLAVRIAPALLRLYRASGRAVSPLDFSSFGRTSSRRASGPCVSRRDYSPSGLHRLYCAYARHLDAPSRRSTSRQSVALALAVCPVILLCVVTTRLADAIDILRLVAPLVVDYFAYAARPGASARRAARHAARRRLL